MNVEFIRPNDHRWRRILSKVAHDVYHQPDYVSLEARRIGGRAVAIWGTCEKGEQFLLPLIVRPLPAQFALPASWSDATAPYGYPSPVTTASDADSLNDFIRMTTEIARENQIIAIFLRWHPVLSPGMRDAIEGETIVEHGETVIVDLSQSCEDWYRQMQSGHRYEIRRLRKVGFRVVVDHWSQLEEFHRIYLATMARVAANESYHFTMEYLDDLRSALDGRLHLASVISPEGNIAAAGLFTECCGIVQYLLSGSVESFSRLAPTKLLLDEVRSWAKQHGNHTFHLGGGVGGRDDALLRFKAGFSDRRGRFVTSRIITDTSRYRLAASSHRARSSEDVPGYFPCYRGAA